MHRGSSFDILEVLSRFSRTSMPLYEYRCSECGETFEVIQKFSDEPLTVHEGCGGSVERLISLSAFQLKGTGWYVTDYGRGGKSTGKNGSKDKSETKRETKTETKTETKAESKSETKASPSTPSK
jgi:putative FmdB family regulatory protein